FGAWIAERINNEQLIVNNCLDIGTGTGLLSVMITQKNPSAAIDAIEIDMESAKQARENVAASPWGGNINIFHSDAREFDYQKKYDIIISNPPFYEKELKGDDMKRNLAHHNEGLLLPELLNIIKKNLEPGGSFYLLLPYKRHEEIKKLLLEHELAIGQITFVRQSVKHDYFRIMLAGNLKKEEKGETEIDELAIWNDQQQYMPQFRKLLNDYYLHL
ncbi:MAG: tRNA1(Val) (adenine(37)-N6)-methyltransferase, partial [Bacteroidota bacterium]